MVSGDVLPGYLSFCVSAPWGNGIVPQRGSVAQDDGLPHDRLCPGEPVGRRLAVPTAPALAGHAS
jgi:hypothetical protein